MNKPEVTAEESEAGHAMMSNAYQLIMKDLYMPWQRHISPADHYRAVQIAQAGVRHTAERQHRESVED